MRSSTTRGVALRCIAEVLCLLLAGTLRINGQSNDPAKLFAEGTRALSTGDLVQAETSFHAVVRLNPSSGAAYSNLGVIAMRQKRWSAALSALSNAERLAPSLTGVRLNMGLVYYRINDFRSASPEFAYVLVHEPASEQARYLLGLSEFFSDQYQEALATLLPLWQNQASSMTYLYVLGSAAHRAHDEATSAKAFKQMAEVGQGSPEFHLYAGKAALGKQEYSQAEVELTAAIAAKPDLPMAHFFLAQIYHERRQDTKAEGALRTEIALEPEVPFSYDELGRIQLSSGHPEQARQNFKSALERDPSLSTAYIGLARIDLEDHEYEQSLALVDQAMKLQPNSGSVHYLRGQILAHLHRVSDARVEFHKTQELLQTFNEQLQKPEEGSRVADAQTTQQATQ